MAPIIILAINLGPSIVTVLVQSPNMKNIWAPWRMSYLRRKKEKRERCMFCRVLSDDHDAVNLVMHRSTHAVIMLNRYPYSNGHMMIVPLYHIASLEDLEPDTMKAMGELTQIALHTLRVAYKPEGFNVGVNIGEAAGAGVPGHVHTHVLPRWKGDTNFMTTVAETRVVPEELEATLNHLQQIMKGLLGNRC